MINTNKTSKKDENNSMGPLTYSLRNALSNVNLNTESSKAINVESQSMSNQTDKNSTVSESRHKTIEIKKDTHEWTGKFGYMNPDSYERKGRCCENCIEYKKDCTDYLKTNAVDCEYYNARYMDDYETPQNVTFAYAEDKNNKKEINQVNVTTAHAEGKGNKKEIATDDYRKCDACGMLTNQVISYYGRNLCRKCYYDTQKEDIKRSIIRRGITSLVHFTNIENIENICKYGILPRTELERLGIKSIYSDDYRFDGNYDSSCFSISMLNYNMFYKKRVNLVGGSKQHYVVLEVDPAVLYEEEGIVAEFYCDNAARADKRNIVGFGADGLRKMFDVFERKGNLEAKYTTNNQAEIQIKGNVPAKYIKAINTESDNDEIRAMTMLNDKNMLLVRTNIKYFDYKRASRLWEG